MPHHLSGGPSGQGRIRAKDFRAEAIWRWLSRFAALSAVEEQLLHDVGNGPATVWEPRSLLDHPTRAPATLYIISGWAAHVRELADGRRQIVELLLPGDSLHPLLQAQQRQTVVCLTGVQTINGESIRLAVRDRAKYPGLASAVDMAAALARARMSQHVVRLGRQTAYERVADLFVDLHERCDAVGLVHAQGYALPLTQEGLGDLLGLSVVHVNRTLQLMRSQNLIKLKQGRLEILDLPALESVSGSRWPHIRSCAPSGEAAGGDGRLKDTDHSISK